MASENVELRSNFIPNENDLHNEWLMQAQQYYDWAKMLGKAKRKRNDLDLERKIIKARLYKESKLKLTAANGGKAPTGADLESEVRSSPEYKSISEQLIIAEEEVDLMDAGKWAMNRFEKSLEEVSKDQDKVFHAKTGSTTTKQEYKELAQERKKEELKETDSALRKSLKSNSRINRS